MEKPEERDHLENLGADWLIILKQILKKYKGVNWVNLAWDRD